MPPPVALPERLSAAAVAAALASDATAVAILAKNAMPHAGDKVGVRLNLNVLKSTKVAVQTLHRATNDSGYRRNKGFYNGEAIGYAEAVVLRHAFFNVHQKGRENIATGVQNKFPMASVDGEFVSLTPDADFEGVPLRFNPKDGHLFVDPEGFAVHGAEEVVVMGHRAYARGAIHYYTQDEAPARAGDAPSAVRFKEPAPTPSLPRRRPGA